MGNRKKSNLGPSGNQLPPGKDNSSDQLVRDGYGRISDRVSTKVSWALNSARENELKVNDEIEELLYKLDENREDRLLSIDFTGMKNHFQVLLDEVLPSFKFRLPDSWTTKYASTLLSTGQRDVPAKPDVRRPTLPKCVADTSNSLYQLRSTDEIRKPAVEKTTPERRVKLTKASPLTGSTPTGSSSLIHSQALGVGKNLVSHTSSQRRFLDGDLDELAQHAALSEVSGSNGIHMCGRCLSMDRAMEWLEKLHQETRQKRLLAIDDLRVTLSGRHISRSVQAGVPPTTSFCTYVDLKRAKDSHEAKNNHGLKSWGKVAYLKDLSLDEYMKYRESKRRAWSASKPKVNVEKKSKRKKINIKRPPFMNVGTVAMSPDHSVVDLAQVPSSEFDSIKRFTAYPKALPSPKTSSTTRQRAVANPSFISPIKKLNSKSSSTSPSSNTEYLDIPIDIDCSYSLSNSILEEMSEDSLNEAANAQTADNALNGLSDVTLHHVIHGAISLIDTNLKEKINPMTRNSHSDCSYTDNDRYKHHTVSPVNSEQFGPVRKARTNPALHFRQSHNSIGPSASGCRGINHRLLLYKHRDSPSNAVDITR